MRNNWKEIPKDDVLGQWSAMYVTLNRKGEIRMSKITYQRLGEPKAVHVLFDAPNRRIGLQAAAVGTRNSFIVRPTGTHGGRVVRVYRLMTEASIVLDQSVRFFDAEIDTDGILTLNLRTASVLKSSITRAKKLRTKN